MEEAYDLDHVPVAGEGLPTHEPSAAGHRREGLHTIALAQDGVGLHGGSVHHEYDVTAG
jgi:hypothetical protein